jgi:hypothetical protein
MKLPQIRIEQRSRDDAEDFYASEVGGEGAVSTREVAFHPTLAG